jgi:hypothetical protein
MAQSTTSKISTGLYLAIASLSVGWLIGLSVSPVVNIIVSSVIVILVSAVTLLGGLNISDEQKAKIPGKGSVNTLPLAILTLFIAVGASIGIYARTHEWLGNKKESSAVEIKTATGEIADPMTGVLFHGDTVSACNILSGKTEEGLRKEFDNIPDSDLQIILKECKTDSCLLHLKNIVCGSVK